MNWFKKNIQPLENENYILKADRNSNYWFGLSQGKIESFKKEFSDNFNIILKGSDNDETDFYVIPYSQVKDLLTKESLYLFNDRKRWVGDINNHILRIRNSPITREVYRFYSNPQILNLTNDEILIGDVDYSIENAKKEISVRQSQSKFRNEVLKNFSSKCCLTGIEETDLLVASHIIPWAAKIESRLDPRNGLSLSIMYDKLFDLGYFTLNENLEVIITSHHKGLSIETQNWLSKIKGQRISNTLNYSISLSAINYHRNNIFEKKHTAL